MRGPRIFMVNMSIGCLAGGFIGFLLRPSAFVIGQLPFQHVITRGQSLPGVERVFMSLARESFNTMMIGAVIGLLAGVVIGYFMSRKSSCRGKVLQRYQDIFRAITAFFLVLFLKNV